MRLSVVRTIGIIAGNGIYPETFAQAAKKQNVRLVAAAFKGEKLSQMKSMT